MFCSWAAEEYGLVGSMEWTEQFGKQLQDRSVAYINVDLSLEGLLRHMLVLHHQLVET